MSSLFSVGVLLSRLRATGAGVLTVAVLVAPLVIVTAARFPALLIFPFLTERHHARSLRLMAALRKWQVDLMTALRGDTS